MNYMLNTKKIRDERERKRDERERKRDERELRKELRELGVLPKIENNKNERIYVGTTYPTDFSLPVRPDNILPWD